MKVLVISLRLDRELVAGLLASISLHLAVLDFNVCQANSFGMRAACRICQRSADGHRADSHAFRGAGIQTPAVASSAPARRDLTIPCGSSTNFFAAPLSKSWYPRGASSNGNTVTFTAFATFTLSCRMAIISCRL